MKTRKKILIHNYAGFEFPFQLAKKLSKSGEDIYYLYSKVMDKSKNSVKIDNEKMKIISIGSEKSSKNNFVARYIHESLYGRLIANKILKIKPSVVISANTPLDAQKKIINACHKNNSKFIFWLQDINSLAAMLILRKKIPLIGSIIGKHYIRLEKKIWKSSDFIIPISKDFIPLLKSNGIETNKIKVIENWAQIENIPITPRKNPWGRKHGLNSKFVFLLMGNLGFKHHPELIIKLAEYFRMENKIKIVIVSEGFAVDWIKKKKQELNLGNLMILPYQEEKDVRLMLASADVLFATLNKDAGTYSVPSRILTYMCANKPIIFIGPKENIMSKTLIKNNSGIVISPKEKRKILSEAENLFKDKKLREKLARNARKYASSKFKISRISKKFIEIINKL